MKLFSLYYSLLEQVPATPPIETEDKDRESVPAGTDPFAVFQNDLATTKTQAEIETVRGDVIDLATQAPNLNAFFVNNGVEISPEITMLQNIFTNVGKEYIWLEEWLSWTFASHMIGSLIHTMTDALNHSKWDNLQKSENEKTWSKNEKKDNKRWSEKTPKFLNFDSLSSILGKASSIFGGKMWEEWFKTALGPLTNALEAVWGVDLFWQTLKANFLMIEMLRIAKSKAPNLLAWNTSVVWAWNGGYYTGSIEFLRKAITANPSVINIADMEVVVDGASSDPFLKELSITENNVTEKHSILSLLWLRNDGDVDKLKLEKSFIDLISTDGTVSGQDKQMSSYIATFIGNWLNGLNKVWKDAVDNRVANRDKYKSESDQAGKIMDIVKEVAGEDTYSMIRKVWNLLSAFFFGRPLFPVDEDSDAASRWESEELPADAGTDVLVWREFGKILIFNDPNSIEQCIANCTLDGESSNDFGTVVMDNNKLPAIGLLQRNGANAKTLAQKLKDKNINYVDSSWVTVSANDFLDKFIEAFYQDGSTLKFRENDVPNRKVNMSAILRTSDWEQVSKDMTKEYINDYIWKILPLVGKSSLNEMTDPEKRAFVFLARVYNAGWWWFKDTFIPRLEKTKLLDLDYLKQNLLETPRTSDAKYVQWVKNSIILAHAYCSTLFGGAPMIAKSKDKVEKDNQNPEAVEGIAINSLKEWADITSSWEITVDTDKWEKKITLDIKNKTLSFDNKEFRINGADLLALTSLNIKTNGVNCLWSIGVGFLKQDIEREIPLKKLFTIIEECSKLPEDNSYTIWSVLSVLNIDIERTS